MTFTHRYHPNWTQCLLSIFATKMCVMRVKWVQMCVDCTQKRVLNVRKVSGWVFPIYSRNMTYRISLRTYVLQVKITAAILNLKSARFLHAWRKIVYHLLCIRAQRTSPSMTWSAPPCLARSRSECRGQRPRRRRRPDRPRIWNRCRSLVSQPDSIVRFSFNGKVLESVKL